MLNNKYKMRTIITLFILIYSIESHGQIKEFLLGKELNLDSWIDKETDKARFVKNVFSQGFFEGFNLDDDYYKDFYVIDFDVDGIIDLLFYGYAGSESKQIILFQNDGSKFTSVFDAMGSLYYVSNNNGFEPLEFAVHHYGCCGDIIDVIEIYKPIQHSNTFNYYLSNKIALINGTKLPKDKFVAPVAFETINPTYILRSEPKINNETGTYPEPIELLGNQVAVYPPKSNGTAYAYEIDETGRKWYFVIMKNNIKPIQSIFHKGYNNKTPYCSFGWISSRYINEIK